MDSPLVSILIPVYNRVTLIPETLASAQNQTYQHLEIVIVDNCSTDGTWEWLREVAAGDSRIRLYQNDTNVGPVRNWKRCIEEANGVYAKILFSDDLISANFIEESVKCFDDDVAFVLAPIQVFGPTEDVEFSKFGQVEEFSAKEYLDNILLVNTRNFPVSPGAAVFRRADLLEDLEIEIENPIALDFERFGAGNDLLLFLNAVLRYEKVKIALKARCYFRSHEESFTTANKLSSYYVYAKYYFIKKNFPNLLPKFKAVTWLRIRMKMADSSTYDLMDTRMDMIYLVKAVIRKFR